MRVLEKQKRVYKLIDGAPLCERTRQVGYCWCDLHPGFLTTPLLKSHECLQKGCPFLERFEDKDFWKQRAKTKESKNKNKAKNKLKDVILDRFRELTSELENFAVCSVELSGNLYTVRCVKIHSLDIADVIKTVSQEFGVKIRVVYIQNTFNARRELISIIKEREANENAS